MRNEIEFGEVMRILAIYSDQSTHDSSCCIYDGESITYFLEERYSGIKHDYELTNCLFNVLKTNLKFDKIVIGGVQNAHISNYHNFDEKKLKKLTDNISNLIKISNLTPNVLFDLSVENVDDKISTLIDKLFLPKEIKDDYTIKEWEKISNLNKKFILDYYKKYNHFPKIEYDSSHHRNHAALCFYNSGFEESIIFVADGAGESILSTSSEKSLLVYKESETIFVGNYTNTFNPIYKNFGSYSGHDYTHQIKEFNEMHPDCEVHFGNYLSLGLMYGSGAKLLHEGMDEAGKVMGLSSYGKPTKNNYIINDLFVNLDLFKCYSYNFIPALAPNGGYPENLIYISVEERNSKERGGPVDVVLPKHIEPVKVVLTKTNYQPYADYAKDLQLQTQEVVVKLIRKAIEKTGIKKVCVCGGYGMNILANSYYVKQFPDVEFYFEPLSTDTGISIGSAMFHYRKESGDTKIRPLKGISFHGFNHDVTPHKGVDTSIQDIAKLLYENKSVAVYTGLAEAGQRALGNRSILFNALNIDAKDIVNKIKRREWYRPFAAVVLEEDAELYFDMGRTKNNLFMTQSFDVKTNLIPGVTHVDNTCRVQTVSSGYLYELLLEFKKLSGHGILLNTSFNLAGKPLIETPKQAIETLNNSVLDYLWFEETRQLLS
jgi:carbamoyltransferase